MNSNNKCVSNSFYCNPYDTRYKNCYTKWCKPWFNLIKRGNTNCDNKTSSTCIDRYYRDSSNQLRCLLGNLNQPDSCCPFDYENEEDTKYKLYSYNGLFHKGLIHKTTNGHIDDPADYELMRNSIIDNNQTALATVPLAQDNQFKLVNPLASKSTVIIGVPQCGLDFMKPPSMSSHTSGAEMVELYCHVLSRDIPFIDYDTEAIIMPSILSHMNNSNVIGNLGNYNLAGNPFTRKSIFRGLSDSEQFGPYISQLLFLNVPLGATSIEQKYSRFTSPLTAVGRVEWGVDYNEVIKMQNIDIGSLPPINQADKLVGYFNNGRALAECVHSDPPFQWYINAAMILSSLGAEQNPGFPSYPNQSPFVTGTGGASIQGMIGIVAQEALKHSWYWKWDAFRRLRPEVFGLWIDNIKNNRALNNGNYEISNCILDNPVLNDIKSYINTNFGISDSYTLPQAYREGSPLHPAYPAGHATISGACATVLKIFFDADKSWNSLPGVQSNLLSGGVSHPVLSDALGNNLVQYSESDIGSMTIEGEINKLASNIAIGRDWAGVHYRSDSVQGMILGEEIAINVVRDTLSTVVENNLDGTPPKFTFRRFNGTLETIIPTVCDECK